MARLTRNDKKALFFLWTLGFSIVTFVVGVGVAIRLLFQGDYTWALTSTGCGFAVGVLAVYLGVLVIDTWDPDA